MADKKEKDGAVSSTAPSEVVYTLTSRLTCRVSLSGVMICPDSNELSKEQLRAVINNKTADFFVKNGDFIVPPLAKD